MSKTIDFMRLPWKDRLGYTTTERIQTILGVLVFGVLTLIKLNGG